VFAAIVTPGQDPFSMLALSLALTLLFEVAVQIARIHDRSKARQTEDWSGLSDEEASPVSTPDAMSTPDPVSTPGPVSDYSDTL